MIRYLLRRLMICIVTVLAAGPASAAWLKAQSKHFVIYSPSAEPALREYTERLERLDAALRVISGVEPDEGSVSNPVTIFMLPNVDDVRVIYGDKRSAVGGFYIPRATGSVAFTPLRMETRAVGSNDDGDLSPEVVLYHEYGHHFLLGNFSSAFPSWFSEGYAEVISTARFDKKSISVGAPANHRAYTLFHGKSIPVEQLLSYGRGKVTSEDVDNLYARGWLLTHYLMFSPERSERMHNYLKLLNEGVPSVKAATQAFGDLKELDRNLDRYLSTRLKGLTVTPNQSQQQKIVITPLSDGAAAMLDGRMRSVRGVDKAEAAKVFAAGQKVGQRYPTDAVAQGWLAEMAFDAGDLAAANAAADAALAADPRTVQALLYKAQVAMNKAADTKPVDPALWTAARSWIIKANKLDDSFAAPLILYYESFARQGIAPTKVAVQGLRRAFELVPQDSGLRLNIARLDLQDGNVKLAIQSLRPLADDPHGGDNNAAAQLIADLTAGKSGPEALAAFDAAFAKKDDKPAKNK